MRRGASLLELIVVLAIMGVIAGVVTLAARPATAVAPDPRATIAAAHDDAIRLRRAVTILVKVDDRQVPVTLFPDGSAMGDSSLRVDRLTARIAHAR